MPAPLEGLRVLEVGQWIAGPLCAALLGDLGADVIKVEKRLGDDQRATPPHRGGMGATFATVNRNKRSIVLDYTQQEDAGVLAGLACQADVLVENLRPGTLARHGLDWASLSPRHQGLVYCSVSGFGQDGPLAAQGAFDIIAQALSGVMSQNGPVGSGAFRLPVPLADVSAALFATIGVLAALQSRQSSGRGQQVDVSLLESAMAFGVLETAGYLATGEEPAKLGAFARNAAPYQVFGVLDGEIVVAAAGQLLWEALCTVLERPDLRADARFATPGARLANNAALEAQLQRVFRTRTAQDWLPRLRAAAIPAAQVLTPAQALQQDQIRVRGSVLPIAGGEEVGAPAMLRTPVRLSATPLVAPHRAPLLDEHGPAIAAALRQGRWPSAETDAVPASPNQEETP